MQSLRIYTISGKLFRLLVAVGMVLVQVALTNADAQTHYNSNVQLGVKGGADLSLMFFNPSVSQDMKPGMLAGVMVRYVEEAHFGIIAECNFVQRGWKEKFADNPSLRYSRTVSYIEIPVLAHMYFGRRGRFFANLGPQIGFRISDKVSSNFDYAHASAVEGFPHTHRTIQYTEPVKQKLDYGICIGLGGEFSVHPRHALSVEARFYYGLGNLFGASRKDNFNGSNSMYLAFSLGYWLRIK